MLVHICTSGIYENEIIEVREHQEEWAFSTGVVEGSYLLTMTYTHSSYQILGAWFTTIHAPIVADNQHGLGTDGETHYLSRRQAQIAAMRHLVHNTIDTNVESDAWLTCCNSMSSGAFNWLYYSICHCCWMITLLRGNNLVQTSWTA